MEFNGFKDLVMKRQSCRSFSGEKIDKETLGKILELSRFAPSACNSQPWKIYCVTDEKVKAGVVKALTDDGMNAFSEKASAFIVITEKAGELKPRVDNRFGAGHFVKYDIGELVAYITLTAKSLGVDSCILGWINHENLKNAVGYPDDEVSNIVIALGLSDIPTREKARKSLSDIVKYI